MHIGAHAASVRLPVIESPTIRSSPSEEACEMCAIMCFNSGTAADPFCGSENSS